MPRGKLTEAVIEEMRKRVLAGETVRSIAKEFNVDYSSVSRAVRGKTWGGRSGIPRFTRLLDALERSNNLQEENNQLLKELIDEMKRSRNDESER